MPETQQTETTTTRTETTRETAHEPVREERKSSLLSDILTIIGFAILFIIIIWGLVHLFQLLASSFSSSKPAPTIQVNAHAQVTSGEPTTISWSYSPNAPGTYAFVYQCEDGLTFQYAMASSSKAAIPCGVAYSAAGPNNSITVMPVLSASSGVNDTISIVFIPTQQGAHAQGNATMAVNPAATPVAPSKTPAKTPSTSYTSNYSGSNGGSANYGGRYSGPADLSVRIISANVDPSGAGVVTFDIGNVGGSASGSYTFSAQLPTAQPYPYVSPLQAPLAPGSHVTSTLRFTDVAPGGGLFSVSILDGNDANASNNYASIQLSAPHNYNSYNNSPSYIQYPAYSY
ncbi:MAG TPA: hypothetical protein VG102_03905 [Candidatus Paceibacterota bacterium]|jgi:hypothetical protein|nr:hypothetical protein [Candidatus Paceibacterota bacterium]